MRRESGFNKLSPSTRTRDAPSSHCYMMIVIFHLLAGMVGGNRLGRRGGGTDQRYYLDRWLTLNRAWATVDFTFTFILSFISCSCSARPIFSFHHFLVIWLAISSIERIVMEPSTNGFITFPPLAYLPSRTWLGLVMLFTLLRDSLPEIPFFDASMFRCLVSWKLSIHSQVNPIWDQIIVSN